MKAIFITFAVLIAIQLILLLIFAQFLIEFSLKRYGISERLWKNTPVDITKLEVGSPKHTIELNYQAAMKKVEMLRKTKEQLVYITSKDNLKLTGRLFMNDTPSHKWLILSHGYRDNPTYSILTYALRYYDLGYNVLTFDQRANGLSEGKYITMSYMEHFDLLSWIDYVNSLDKEAKIVLHGHSMGAATVLMATGEECLPANVCCAISDCAFSSILDEFEANIKSMYHLPPYPILYVANLLSRIEVGLDFRKGNVTKAVEKSHTPTFFIHGDIDTFVPTKMVNKLFDAAACEKKLYIAHNAAHVDSQFIDPDKYYSQVFEFIDQYMA